MKCERVWDLLSAYADNETTSDETAIVETHIAVCSGCARDLQWLRAATGALLGVADVEPPITLNAAILAATVYRPMWQQHLRAGFGTAASFRTLRYGALAGSVAMAAWLAVNVSGPVATNPAAYRPAVKAAEAKSPADPLAESTGPSTLFTARLEDNITIPVLGAQPPLGAPGKSEPARRFAASSPASELRSIQPRTTRRTVADATRLRGPVLSGPIPDEPSTMLDEMPMMSDVTTAPTTSDMGTAGAGTPANVPPTIARPVHVALASYSEPVPQTGLVTLADLKRSLRRENQDGRAQFIRESIDEKRIRLDVVRGRF
jgi:hypothetical protein